MRTKLTPPPKPIGPKESPEALQKKAESTHKELTRLMAGIRADKERRLKILAELVGRPTERDRFRLVWAGLVQFVNEKLDGKTLEFEVAAGLRATIALVIHDDQELEDLEFDAYKLEVFEDINRLQKMGGISADHAFSKIAIELQPKLRNLLEWVADPNRISREARRDALSLLVEYGEQQMARYAFDINDQFDDTGNVGYPLFYWKRPQCFETVIAPIARFIFERMESYHDGKLTLDEAAPLVLCKREGCGRLSMSERKTKDFCSSSCRTLHRQKEKAEEHAAYMRKYRRENYTKPSPSSKRK